MDIIISHHPWPCLDDCLLLHTVSTLVGSPAGDTCMGERPAADPYVNVKVGAVLQCHCAR